MTDPIDGTEPLADRERQFGAVECVEVDVLDAVLGEFGDLLGRQFGGDRVRASRSSSSPAKRCATAPGNGRPAPFGEAGHGGERVDREHAGHEWDVEPAAGDPVAVAQEQLVVEEHLRDRPVGAGGDLLGEHVEVVGDRRRLGVTLRIGGHGDVEAAARFTAATRSAVRWYPSGCGAYPAPAPSGGSPRRATTCSTPSAE